MTEKFKFGQLVKVNEDVVFLSDEHLGVLGVVTKIVDNTDKYEDSRRHPEILQHLIDEHNIYGQDIIYVIYTSKGERLRLFYNEFTLVE